MLGPLLFLLYVNDIANVLPGENVKLFADDTNLFISGIDSSGHFGDIQCQTMAWSWKPGWGSFKVIENGAVR